jgi:poly(hydroxyalkanoate) granule-associated protein
MTENDPGIDKRARKLGREIWLVGLGAVAMAGDETRRLIERLRDRGERFEQDESNSVRKAYDGARGKVRKTGDRVEGALRGTVGSALQRSGVPSQDEIRTLIERVEQLTARVDNLRAAR